VNHAKGWGEVDAEVLYILAVSGARKLIKLEPLSITDLQVFTELMGSALDDDAANDPDGGDDKPAKRTAPVKKLVAKKAVKRPVKQLRKAA